RRPVLPAAHLRQPRPGRPGRCAGHVIDVDIGRRPIRTIGGSPPAAADGAQALSLHDAPGDHCNRLRAGAVAVLRHRPGRGQRLDARETRHRVAAGGLPSRLRRPAARLRGGPQPSRPPLVPCLQRSAGPGAFRRRHPRRRQTLLNRREAPGARMDTIEYYYTPISPWTYFGHQRLAEIAKRHGARIAMKPCDLGPVFAATGGLPLPKRPPARLAYRLVELQRWREVLGIEL